LRLVIVLGCKQHQRFPQARLGIQHQLAGMRRNSGLPTWQTSWLASILT